MISTYLHFLKLLKSFFILIRLEIEKRDVAFDLAGALVDERVVVLKNVLGLELTLQGSVELVSLFLDFSELDRDLGKELSV